jgi:enamine deaminase RidA (YjgF/YER057c/UK114 family)
MSIVERINPNTVYPPYNNNYTQVTRARGTLVEVAGIVAFDENSNLVGDNDMSQQTQQILKNIDLLLQSAGATRQDCTRMMIFTLDTRRYLKEGHPHVKAFFGDNLPTSTLVGCKELAEPRFIVEIQVSAVIDDQRTS